MDPCRTRAEKKVSVKRLKIAECEAKVFKLEALARPKAREKKSLEKEKAKLVSLRDELASLEQLLQEAQAKVAHAAAAAAAKAKAAAAQEEVTRAMSDADLMLLCELRGKYGNKFENTSDTNDSVWQHLALES